MSRAWVESLDAEEWRRDESCRLQPAPSATHGRVSWPGPLRHWPRQAPTPHHTRPLLPDLTAMTHHSVSPAIRDLVQPSVAPSAGTA